MAVVYNSAPTTGTADFGVTSITSPTFTIAAGSNLAALIGLGAYTNIFGDSFTVSCSGASATAITGAAGWTGTIGVKLFGALGPAAGAGKTATAAWSTSADFAVLSVEVASGVDSFSNGTYGTGGTPASLAVTSATGDLTGTAAISDQGSTSPTSNKTRTTTSTAFAMDYAAGAASNTHTWSDPFAVLAIAGANFVQAGGTPAVTPRGTLMGVGP